MVAKRGKKQARRSGESSVPGYVWLLSGLLIGGAVAVTLYVKMPHAIDDLMPHPNLTAKPAVANDSSAAAEGNPAASPAASSALAEPKKPKFTFYALLPEKEVIIPDEELSAQVKAEAAANLASNRRPRLRFLACPPIRQRLRRRMRRTRARRVAPRPLPQPCMPDRMRRQRHRRRSRQWRRPWRARLRNPRQPTRAQRRQRPPPTPHPTPRRAGNICCRPEHSATTNKPTTSRRASRCSA